MAIDPGTALTAVSNAIKEAFPSGKVTNQILTNSLVWKLLKTRGQNMRRHLDETHTKLAFPIRMSVAGGAGKANATTGALPTASKDPTISKFSLSLPEYWIRLLFDHNLLNCGSARVIGNEVLTQVQMRVELLSDMMSSAFLTDGSGMLTEVTGAGTGASGTAHTVPVKDVNAVKIGEYCQIIDGSNASVAHATACLVIGKSVKSGAGSLTVTSNSTGDFTAFTSSYKVVMENTTQDSVNPHGLSEIVNNEGYYPSSGEDGLDRDAVANKDWTSEVIDSSGADYLDKTVFELFDLMMLRLAFTGGESVVYDSNLKRMKRKATQFIYADQNILGMLLDDARPHRRITTAEVEDIGMNILHINGVPAIPDPRVVQRAYFLNLKNWHFFEDPLDWAPGTSGHNNLFSRDPGTKNYEAAGSLSAQIHCDRLRDNGVVKNVDTQTFEPDAPSL